MYLTFKIIKMDLGTALIGLLSIIICALPFVLSSRSTKKKEKELLLSLNGLAEKLHCNISEYEICGNYAIGIDEANKYVFFQLKNEEEIKSQFIDLSSIKKCNLINIGRSANLIEHLNLEFISSDKNKTNANWEFYNSNVSIQLNGELQSINKWHTLINDKLINK